MPIKEKSSRNKAIVALYLCGFTEKEIGEFTNTNPANVHVFKYKYLPKYFPSVADGLLRTLLPKELIKVVGIRIRKRQGRPKKKNVGQYDYAGNPDNRTNSG